MITVIIVVLELPIRRAVLYIFGGVPTFGGAKGVDRRRHCRDVGRSSPLRAAEICGIRQIF